MRALQGSVPVTCSNAPLARPAMALQQQVFPSLVQQQQQRCIAAHAQYTAAAAPWPAQTASLHRGKPNNHVRYQLQRRSTVSVAAAAATEQAVDSAAAIEQLRNRLQLHNSMSRKKEQFTPRPEMGNKVQMYVCGVTVYDYSHIGGFRG